MAASRAGRVQQGGGPGGRQPRSIAIQSRWPPVFQRSAEPKLGQQKKFRHEQFAQRFVKTGNPTKSYTSVYGEAKGAAQSASRLLTHANISARIYELQVAIANGVVELAISKRNARITALQHRWDRLRERVDTLMDERGEEMARGEAAGVDKDGKECVRTPVPGGSARTSEHGYRLQDRDHFYLYRRRRQGNQ
jgi:hypothetical protein